MIKLSPLTQKKIKRFKSIRRGYYSLIFFVALLTISLGAELLINNRALIVCYKGELYFPVYGGMLPGKTFGLDYEYETDYRRLKVKFRQENKGDWLLLPLVPYSPYETDLREDGFPPFPPSFKDRHYLGTDAVGRDLAARLVYGFRICAAFSLLLTVANFSAGIFLGCLMGYLGGWFDLFFQRIIEIWSAVPFLYIIMIISSALTPNLLILTLIYVMFGWMGLTWYMRTAVYKEKTRDYAAAAKTLGASDLRIIFKHILPNSISLIITFVPFSIAGGINALTALDYLGFGLQAPAPSWGEMLRQGTDNLQAPWIISTIVAAMSLVMISVTFIGEAAREAFDPKMRSTFE